MNLNGKGDGDELSLTSSGLASSFHQLKVPLSEQQSMEEKSTRIKRRRTRRERNYVKFGRNVTGMIPDQRPNCRGRQKMLPPFWSSQLSCAKSTPIKRPCVSKPVIITQNRLTQHLGMFNREVKSADIERLLSPRTEHDVMEITPIQRTSGGLLGEVVPSCSSCDMNLKSIPSKQVGCIVKDSSTMNEDSHFTVTPAVPGSTSEHHSPATLQKVDASYHPSLAPAAVKFDHQSIEAETFKGNSPVTLNDKENVPPVSAEGTELGRSKPLVRELAQDLQKLLDLKAIFPGRNLINEMRQTVISALLQQNKTLPDLSALTVLKKIAGSCNMDAFHSDFKTPANEDQQNLHLEVKSVYCRSKSSNQPLSLKKQREQEQSFLTCFSHGPVHTTADKKLAQREDSESFADPELTNQPSFFLAAVQPHSSLSSSSQPVNFTRSSFASEEQFALQGTFLRTAEPWEQGLGDALWEPRGKQGSSEVANRAPPKKMDISKRHRLPLAAHNTFGSASLSIDSKGSGCFLLADPQQYSYFYKLSPDRLNLQGAESVPAYNLHPSQELCSSQPLDLGLRAIERATSESQTSFDVLKSIWSPNMPRKGVKLPVSRALGYPCLTHQLLSSRELNLEQGQPKEFFQLCNIIPQQPRSSCRQHFQQEGCVPSKLPPMKNGFSVLGKPRVYCQKDSAEQGRISENYQIWGLAETSKKMHDIRDKGTSRPGNQVCGLEGLLHPEHTQQLQALQQLPMSYFPPSEALESGNSPLCTLQGHLLGQSSPEPWTFPRMKLY